MCLTSASSVFGELGYDPQQNYPIEIRLNIQEAILKSFSKQYVSIGERAFIADRTPIDLMAYTLADIGREALPNDVEERLKKYVSDCFGLCNLHFSTLILLQAGIALVADPSKAPISFGYSEHIAQLVMGLTLDERVTACHSYIPKRITDLEERVLCVRNTVLVMFERVGTKIRDYVREDGLVALH